MPKLFPLVGDTALRVSTLMLDASAVVTVTRGLELGARYSYSAYGWSSETVAGTMPLPGRSGLRGLGPELHGAVGFGPNDEFMLGFAGNLLAYRIPTASWVRSSSCTPGPNCYDAVGPNLGLSRYQIQDESHSDRLVLNLGVFASESIPGGKAGHLFTELNLHDGFKNVGFTDQPGAPALQGGGLIPLLSIGYGLAVDGFRVSAMASHAFTASDAPVSYGFSTFVVTLGGDVALWHSAD